MTTSRPHDAAHASSTSPTFARPARYEAAVLSDLSEAMAIVAREAPNGLATPFQTELWLNAWRKVYAGDASEIETMFIVARAMHAEHQDGALAMILPVTRQRHEGLLFISSFDAGVTDYNAPILGPAAPSDSADARRMWRAIKLALPPADVIEIVKSPREAAGRVNPLALLKATRPSTLSGNILHIDEPFDAFVRRFERKFRKELGREKRVFESIPGARFEVIADLQQAARVFAELDRMQAARMRALGRDYWLDGPNVANFYQQLLRDGLPRGETVITALFVGDEVVAALLGVIAGDHYAMVRLGQAGAPWSHFSPGRLVIMETMRVLRERGLRRFDFTIGDYDYKRRLGAVPVPLIELIEAASWRGAPRTMAARARAIARRSPMLRRIAGRIRAAIKS